MTTILSLAARDFIVVGCDSLATTSMPLARPQQLVDEFFDSKGNLKIAPDGLPLLRNPAQIWTQATQKPVNQLPSVTKLFDLGVPTKNALPSPQACLLFAGASQIGEITIRNLVETFKADNRFKSLRASYTMTTLVDRLKDFVLEVYAQQIPDEWARPFIEIMISGYSSQHREPEVWKLLFYWNQGAHKFQTTVFEMVKRGDHNLNFGGQNDVIQRVVTGIDQDSFEALRARTTELLDESFQEVENTLRSTGFTGTITKPDFTSSKYDLFGKNRGGVTQLFYGSDVGSLSEQAGIDLVYFLIDVMIKAQEFSNSIPTVGGDIHVGRLTKNDGFRWISPETYKFKEQHIPKF
jgi:hypothetical protein